MKKRKLLGVMAALALTVISLGNGMVHTYAANGDYVDKPFSFYVDGLPEIIEPRMKYTSTSIYVRVDNAPTDFVSVQVHAFIGNYWTNKAVGTTARVPRSPEIPSATGYRVRAAVLESNNYNPTKVRLCFPDTSPSGTVQGYWSPDCKGNYPAVN